MWGYRLAPSSGNNWKLGLMVRKWITGSGANCLYKLTYESSPAISNDDYYGPTSFDNQVYVPRLTKKEIIIDGKTYTTSYSNFDNYSQPRTIQETSDATRTITRTYWYNPSLNIIDRLASETVNYNSTSFATNYSYNDIGLMTSKSVAGVTTTYTYHNDGNLKRTTDASNRWIENEEYQYGVPRRINKGGVYTINRTINWSGTIASETNGRGYTTSFLYDGRNRLTRITPPIGDVTNIEYHNQGDYKKVSQGQSWIKYNYDDWCRVDYTENSVGIKVDYTYDKLGRKTFESYPYTNSRIGDTLTYDGLDRIKRITHPDNSYCEYTYYQSKITYRNERGKNTEFQYLGFGTPFGEKLLGSVKDALNQTTNYSYNAAGYLTSISAAGNYNRTYNYNSKYFLASEIAPERGQINYSYDNAGNLIQRTDANGNITNYTYDNATRLTAIDYPGALYDINFYYDYADNCTLMTTPTNVCSLYYDPLNRVTRKVLRIDGFNYTVSFTYDSRGNITRITYPGNWSVDYTYDSENRVLTIPNYINNNITYHPSGREASFTLVNGRATSYTYNNRYFITNITVNGNTMNESYQYDAMGNLTNLTDNLNSANNQTFTYDDIDRLKTFNGPWGSGTYNYASNYAISRRTQEIIGSNTTTYNYHNTTHRLMTTTGALTYTFTYDNNGNTTGINGGKNLTITYDYENRPVSINNLDLRNTDFIYDAKGVRVKKVLGPFIPLRKEDNNIDGAIEDVYYYLTGLQGEVLCEIEKFGQGKTYYVYLNGKKLCRVRGSNKYFYHNDYLGSAKAMTDNSGIKIYSWLGYPFGQQYSMTGGAYNNYRFTGKEYDATTGLYYFGARYYMPEIGRFITADPIVGLGNYDLTRPNSLSFYCYVTDNPLKYIDPDGRREMTPYEVEVVRKIMETAEQVYFSEKSRAYESVRFTGGSWPEDMAAGSMKPVSLEGLPGELPFGYMLKLRRDQFLSRISFGIYDPGTLPNQMDHLVYKSSEEEIWVNLALPKEKRYIYYILHSREEGTYWAIVEYRGKNGEEIIKRFLSPRTYEEWLKRIDDYEKNSK